MKVYVDANDTGKTVTFEEENGKRQYLYVHDKEGFIFKELAEHDKQVRKDVCDEIRKKLKLKEIFHPEYDFEIDYDFYYKEDVDEILDQIQEDR